MAELDEGNDERESSGDEIYSSREEASASWSVTEQQKKMEMMDEFNKLEIDVSLQRKEATAEGQFGLYT